MNFERSATIERAEGDSPGLISGILATGGEASDGHILNIDGAELPERAPLLFGHDDFTGTGNLGSWEAFATFGDARKPGGRGIRGQAQIELGGEGTQKAWRQDVNHMISEGHIGQFSVRWDPVGDPIQRTNLPKEHGAFVDSKKATGANRWGLYFEKWRMLEGSVVTLGADPNALIGRMRECDGDLRTFWGRAVASALSDVPVLPDQIGVNYSDDPDAIAIQLEGDELAYVSRAAYEAMLELANSRLLDALDVQGEVIESLRGSNVPAELPVEPEEPEQETHTETLPVARTTKSVGEIFREILKEDDDKYDADLKALRDEIRRARGVRP